ncbi:hypothetical protein Anapl_00686 [Anas platyrhynchos]|uniref:Uncharacterized protein n=1 Tax=Anas platyrhynchos TaxID=8839 RepID=R0K166_ANAPL|nr:hypothetical protein Anapl_00686 [Anas platyrhynchos]
MVGLIRSPGYMAWAVFSERIQIIPDIEGRRSAQYLQHHSALLFPTKKQLQSMQADTERGITVWKCLVKRKGKEKHEMLVLTAPVSQESCLSLSVPFP